MEQDWDEIGSGEDGHYDWIHDFADLKEIERILVDFESDNKLEVVKKRVPCWGNSSGDPDLWTLIEPFVRSEREFHDPDQPNASWWETIFVRKDVRNKLRVIIGSTLEQLQDLKDEHLTEKGERPAIAFLKIPEPEYTKEHQAKQSDLINQIVSHLQSGIKDLECFGNFLVSKSLNQVFYLSEHKSYRKTLPEEESVANELEKNFCLVRTYESSQPDDPWIAYFAGQRRLRVMGWGQTHSLLHHEDEETLKLLFTLREQFNKNDETHAPEN